MSNVRVPPDSTGKRVDTLRFIDEEGNDVHRQVISPSDNLTGTATHGATSRLSLQFAAVLAGGTGYAIGDFIVLAGGTSVTAAMVEVIAVSGSGAITGVKVTNIGRYSVTTGTLTQSSTTGSGTGATFTATWANDVLAMIDTTGFNYFQFAYVGTWNFSSTGLMGSFDNGLTWINVRWFHTSYNGTSPVAGGTGSATDGTIHYCCNLPPLLRVTDSGNNTIQWSLKNTSIQTNAVSQGGNSGTNNNWYITGLKSAFGGNGHPSNYASGTKKIISAASTNSTLVFNAGNPSFGLIHLQNSHATNYAYLKIYAKNTAPNVGVDIPILTIAIPPNQPPVNINMDVCGFTPTNVAAGWGYAITGGFADSDATAVAAGQVVGFISYG